MLGRRRSGAARAQAPLRQVATPRNWLRGRVQNFRRVRTRPTPSRTRGCGGWCTEREPRGPALSRDSSVVPRALFSAPLYLPSRRNNARSRIPAPPAGYLQTTFTVPGVLPALTGRLPNHTRSKFDQLAACQASDTSRQPTRAMVLPSSSVKFSGPRKVMYSSLSSSKTV